MIKLELDPDIRDLLYQKSQPFEFAKNEMIIQMGTVCKYVFFIEQGMVRNFYYDQNGHDVTHWFSSEKMMVYRRRKGLDFQTSFVYGIY